MYRQDPAYLDVTDVQGGSLAAVLLPAALGNYYESESESVVAPYLELLEVKATAPLPP